MSTVRFTNTTAYDYRSDLSIVRFKKRHQTKQRKKHTTNIVTYAGFALPGNFLFLYFFYRLRSAYTGEKKSAVGSDWAAGLLDLFSKMRHI